MVFFCVLILHCNLWQNPGFWFMLMDSVQVSSETFDLPRPTCADVRRAA